ncbi:MAG: hypothetical protein ACREQ5_21575 [Candidatus Dormibacteria bacterium]
MLEPAAAGSDEVPTTAPRRNLVARTGVAVSPLVGCGVAGWRLPLPIIEAMWCIGLVALAIAVVYITAVATSVFPVVRARATRALEVDVVRPSTRCPACTARRRRSGSATPAGFTVRPAGACQAAGETPRSTGSDAR